MIKVIKVKNKTPAKLQITAEQLLQDAKKSTTEQFLPPFTERISDASDLADYQLRKRKLFEDNIRKNRTTISNWLKYAKWEESQKEIQRTRSIYERVLDIDHKNITIWIKYSEMELRNRQINHARNLFDRATAILPRINQIWYKYVHMEEILENFSGVRSVFERWMEWQPDEQAWQTYINFELRYKELDRARQIYERFVLNHPIAKNWIKYAKFEEFHGFINSARQIYLRTVNFHGDDGLDEGFYIAFARFEEDQKEYERAKVILKYAMENLPKELISKLDSTYTIHEKKYGNASGIEDFIVMKRKAFYEENLLNNPFNYDLWFDYLRLAEGEGGDEATRNCYEKAIANVPLVQSKQCWRRYMYLWINYALFEEIEIVNYEKTRQVYKACLNIIPHKIFTFSKIWIYFAYFEIRQKNVTAARKILGTAIGMCPTDKLFRNYIEMEIQLREFDRCRILYEKFLEFRPENCLTWIKFAELETMLGEADRVRALYELGIRQEKMDLPELLWKAYIDFEILEKQTENARRLFERLLNRAPHVKIWLSYAKFELNNNNSDFNVNRNIDSARDIFERAYTNLQDKDARILLLKKWVEFESLHGDETRKEKVLNRMPRIVKKQQKIYSDDGTLVETKEIFDYVFSEEESNSKLLIAAKKWKKEREDKNQENPVQLHP